MKKMRIDEVCLDNPRQSVNLPENSKISFVPMAAVSVNGQVDSCDTLELKKAKNYTVFQNGDVLFAKITPCMENGKGAIVRNLLNGYGAGSTEFIVLRPKENVITAKWLYLYLSQRSFRWECQQHMTGSAGQKRVPPKYLASCEMPVPSIEVQERIVSKIEELFSKLDASVAELKIAKEKLKVYRQAVLKEAFDSVRSVCMTTTIKSVCETIKVGIVIKPTQYYVKTDGVFAFRNANVRRNYIEDNDWAMISQEGHQKNLKSQVHTDDVLIARSGVNLGMAAAVPEKYDGYNAIDIVIAVPKKNFVLPKYLAQYTNSPYGVEIVKKNQHGAAQGHLNVKEYGNLPIFLPNISVQNELLQKIESRLSVCDSIEQTIDTSLQQVEALRQSILKQAFEGRLI